ncbi:hypothetical protein ACWJJH_03135 [Endozoicomonadaceae bacterium StTr2]
MKKIVLLPVVALLTTGCTAFMNGYNREFLDQALSVCWDNPDKVAAMECHKIKYKKSGITVIPKSNALAVWGSGYNERLLISKSHRSITAVSPTKKKTITFKIVDSTVNNDCVDYIASSTSKMEICFGSDVTLYVNNQSINAGSIEMDNGSMVSARATAEYLAVVASKVKSAKAEQENQQFKLLQERRRIEAETKAIEKSEDSIDAVNDAVRSIGKGIENHGIN